MWALLNIPRPPPSFLPSGVQTTVPLGSLSCWPVRPARGAHGVSVPPPPGGASCPRSGGARRQGAPQTSLWCDCSPADSRSAPGGPPWGGSLPGGHLPGRRHLRGGRRGARRGSGGAGATPPWTPPGPFRRGHLLPGRRPRCPAPRPRASSRLRSRFRPRAGPPPEHGRPRLRLDLGGR